MCRRQGRGNYELCVGERGEGGNYELCVGGRGEERDVEVMEGREAPRGGKERGRG